MQDEIVFIGKYKKWAAIKKMSINEKTEDREVAAILASINSTLKTKTYDFLGIDTSKIDEYAAKVTKGKRKTYSNLADVLGKLKTGEVNKVLAEASPEKTVEVNGKQIAGDKLKPVAEIYFMRALLSGMGYDVDASPEVIGKIYPDLKKAKPRGRFKKGQ